MENQTFQYKILYIIDRFLKAEAISDRITSRFNTRADSVLVKLSFDRICCNRDALSACGMEILGTRVVRGRDWEWGNQDGGEGCVGTVVQIGQDKKSPFTTQLVWIQWDCRGKANYRAGFDGKHDLCVLDTRNQGEI